MNSYDKINELATLRYKLKLLMYLVILFGSNISIAKGLLKIVLQIKYLLFLKAKS